MTVAEALRIADNPRNYTSLEQADVRTTLAAEVRRLEPIEQLAREVDELARQGRIATFGGDDTGALYRLREALGTTD